MGFDWPDLGFWALGVVGTGFSIWLTAWLSFRASVRQKVWQKVFEQKWETIGSFSTSIDQFSQRMLDLHNASLTWQEKKVHQALVRAHGLYEFTWPQKDRPLDVSQAMLHFPEPNTSSATRTRLEQLLTGYRNLVFQDMARTYGKIQTGFSQLALTGYDPAVAKDLEILAMNWLNRVSAGNLPYEGLDFDDFFSQWKSQGRLTKLLLRQDLVMSAKSLRRALRLSKKWKSAVESAQGSKPA